MLGDLTELEMSFYDVILGMDCPKARVNIPRAKGKTIYEGFQANREIPIVYMLRAEELLEGGAGIFGDHFDG